ncbi:MAG: type II toxin-antitoxin system HicB family antitoxin [Isosphaeraceae bacterium]
MRISVLIEPVPGHGYRAKGGEPFAMTAEGPTRDDALQELRKLIERKVSAGAEIVTLDVPVAEHPWLPFAGMFRDDPLVEEWKETMSELRRQADEAELVLERSAEPGSAGLSGSTSNP